MGLHVDTNIIDAVERFFMLGLHPGSCTSLLLAGDYDRALQHAHHLIRPDEIWDDHITFIEDYIPRCCRGENFHAWIGYEKEVLLDPQLDVVIKLEVRKAQVVDTWIYKYKHDTEDLPCDI